MPDPWKSAVEQTIRDLIADQPDLPIRGAFYRGPGQRDYVTTPGCPGEWFVNVQPSSFEVAVAALGRYEWGAHDVIGRAAVVELPQSSRGVVDVDAVRSSRFEVELLAAVREKAAVIAQMLANVHA